VSEPSSDRALQDRDDAGWGGRWKEYRTILIWTVTAGLFLKLFVVEAYRIPSPSMEETLSVGDFLLVNKLAYGPRSPRYLPLTSIRIPGFASELIGRPQRGDVVIFESPAWRETGESGPVIFVKRCIAGPGDTVAIENSTVIVNGVRLRLPPTAKQVKLIPFPPGFVDPRIYPSGAQYNSENYGPLRIPALGQVVSVDTSNIGMWEDLLRREGHAVSIVGGSVQVDGRACEAYTVEHDYYFMMGDNRRNSLDSRFWGFVPDDLVIGKAMLIYWSWDEAMAQQSFASRFGGIHWGRIGTLVR